MIKEAYKKSFKMAISMAAILWTMLIIIELMFRPSGISMFHYTGTVTYKVQLILFAFLFLFICNPFFLLLRCIIAVWKFKKSLNHIDSYERERLDEDFLADDRFGDIYLTRSGIIIHQCRIRAPIQYKYIPYNNIINIHSTFVPRHGKKELEIVLNNASSKCYVAVTSKISENDIIDLNKRIQMLCSGFNSVYQNDDTSAVIKKNEKEYLKFSIKNSPLLLIIVNFFSLVLYLMCFLGILYLPEKIIYVMHDSPNVYAYSIFWPNVLFILLTVIIVLFLLLFAFNFIKNYKINTLQIKLFMQSCLFTLIVVALILFLSIAYGKDVNLIQQTLEAFKQLV